MLSWHRAFKKEEKKRLLPTLMVLWVNTTLLRLSTLLSIIHGDPSIRNPKIWSCWWIKRMSTRLLHVASCNKLSFEDACTKQSCECGLLKPFAINTVVSCFLFYFRHLHLEQLLAAVMEGLGYGLFTKAEQSHQWSVHWLVLIFVHVIFCVY